MTLHNLARVTSATTGTGAITLGAAVAGYLSFADAGVANGELVTYAVRDGSNSEIGIGTYATSGAILTRTTILNSTNSGNAITLTGDEEVFVTVSAQDLSGRRVLISEASPNGTNAVTFASIPSYFTTLEIEWVARSARASQTLDTIDVKLNNDTTAGNYRSIYGVAGGATTIAAAGADTFLAARVSAGNSPANSCGIGKMFIPYYSETNFNKEIYTQSNYRADATNFHEFVLIDGVEWESTAAVTQVALVLTNSTYIAGSKFRLYGVY